MTERAVTDKPAPPISRNHFDAEVEAAYLRMLRLVVAGTAAGQRSAPAEALRAEIDATDAVLGELRENDDLPMAWLARSVGLSPLEQQFVWSAVALGADPRMQVHAQSMAGSEARKGLSLSLFANMWQLDGTSSRALARRITSSHPLLRRGLLELAEHNVVSAAAPLRASARLVSFLAGDDTPDVVRRGLGGPVKINDALCFDEDQLQALERIAEGLGANEPVVVIEGSLGSGRRTAAAIVAARSHRQVLAVDVTRLAPTVEALESAVLALRRDCSLCDALPVIAEIDDLLDGGTERDLRIRALVRLLDVFPGPVLVTTSRAGIVLQTHRSLLRVSWNVPDTATRKNLWQRYLGGNASVTEAELDLLALRYRLPAGGIERAASAAHLIGQSRSKNGVDTATAVAGVRNNITERLGSLARRVDVKQTWDDLVLAPDVMDQIHALVGRVRHSHQVYEKWGFNQKAARGIGVAALLSGPPGTGKSMVAGLIAKELDLELLEVDLSQVVSKWIGETEKQLSKVFDIAEAGHALLLFDEADALFAKRTEVKGSTDRYANLEVNFLLHRVESFGGITILTTNLDANMDKALKRRLAGHVVFWAPDEDERKELWRRMLKTGRAPLAEDIDLSDLAHEFTDMTGANIRNAVLAAAFLAASENSIIGQDHLLRAANGEYRTMGRVLR